MWRKLSLSLIKLTIFLVDCPISLYPDVSLLFVILNWKKCTSFLLTKPSPVLDYCRSLNFGIKQDEGLHFHRNEGNVSSVSSSLQRIEGLWIVIVYMRDGGALLKQSLYSHRRKAKIESNEFQIANDPFKKYLYAAWWKTKQSRMKAFVALKFISVREKNVLLYFVRRRYQILDQHPRQEYQLRLKLKRRKRRVLISSSKLSLWLVRN